MCEVYFFLTCFFCFFPPYFLLALPFFFPLAIVLHFSLSLSLSLHSSSEPTPRQPVQPRGGSNQLNYWEHKNAAANGSWINTLAKLLPRLPLLPQGIKLKILRLRMQRREAMVEVFVWGWGTVMTRPGHRKDFWVQRANLIMILVIYWRQMQQRYKNWRTIECLSQPILLYILKQDTSVV